MCSTCEYRDDCFVYCLNLLLVQHVTGKEGGDEKHDKDE